MDYSRMYMQSYYIQDPPIYPNHAKRPVVASNNLVQQDVDCSKENEKSKEQDSKYLQLRWCPSGLSHTQKRRLQCMHKKETLEQQVEAVPKTSATMKMVWRPKQVVSTSTWLEQVTVDNYLSPLAQIMADVMIIIALRQFWLRKIFFGKQAWPKNRKGICWQPKLAPTGLTGPIERSDRSRHCCQSGRDRPVWPV